VSVEGSRRWTRGMRWRFEEETGSLNIQGRKGGSREGGGARVRNAGCGIGTWRQLGGGDGE
jgi:hypothetical protein